MRSFAAGETNGFNGNFRSTFTILYRKCDRFRNSSLLQVTNGKVEDSYDTQKNLWSHNSWSCAELPMRERRNHGSRSMCSSGDQYITYQSITQRQKKFQEHWIKGEAHIKTLVTKLLHIKFRVVELPSVCLWMLFGFKRWDPIKKLIAQYTQAPDVNMIVMLCLLNLINDNRS